MNLDELQSVQARERQSSDLQHLRSSFYQEVGEFIQGLTEERARVVERTDDPFSSPEVRQLSDDIETAEQTVEAIYERRVGKVVKKASIAAAGMPVDDDGLTHEEETLFEDLVARIEDNRESVLSVLDGDVPSVSCSIEGETETEADANATTADPSPPSPSASDPGSAPGRDAIAGTDTESSGVSAADLMGSGPDEDATAGAADTTDAGVSPAADRATATDDPPVTDAGSGDGSGFDAGADEEPQQPSDDPLAADPGPTEVPPAGSPGDGSGAAAEASAAEGTSSEDRPAPTASERDVPGVPRTTVRITADVGEVVGADDRDYDLGAEDVVKLPESNAEVLVENDAAEPLE